MCIPTCCTPFCSTANSQGYPQILGIIRPCLPWFGFFIMHCASEPEPAGPRPRNRSAGDRQEASRNEFDLSDILIQVLIILTIVTGPIRIGARVVQWERRRTQAAPLARFWTHPLWLIYEAVIGIFACPSSTMTPCISSPKTTLIMPSMAFGDGSPSVSSRTLL